MSHSLFSITDSSSSTEKFLGIFLSPISVVTTSSSISLVTEEVSDLTTSGTKVLVVDFGVV